MSSVYDLFTTDTNIEKEGILVRYGHIRFLIARAGGSNKSFIEAFKQKSKPYRYLMDNNQMNEEDSLDLMSEVYAETVVRGWETKVGDKWKPFIEGKDGAKLEFNRENCIQVLKDLPELFKDLQQMASKVDNFIKTEEEKDVKNLQAS